MTYTVGIYVCRVTDAVGVPYVRHVTYIVGIWHARHVTLYRERTGVCEITVNRTRLCYWIAQPAKPGVQSSNTSRVRFTVILHTLVHSRFYHMYCTNRIEMAFV